MLFHVSELPRPTSSYPDYKFNTLILYASGIQSQGVELHEGFEDHFPGISQVWMASIASSDFFADARL